MKDHPLGLIEREFILKAIEERKRLDGRGIYDSRGISVNFGHDRGHVEVAVGDTRVLCQVSGEVVKPSGNRPTEGVLFFNVELSPMASASFEPGRASPLAVQLSRFLEHALKDSRAVDTESLCIIADEKVWSIRVDVHVLDHCGGLAMACSIAAVLGLSHFRRPDVSVVGEQVTIHSLMDRDPVPLNVYHMPICICIGFLHDGNYMIIDPTWQEERVMDGALTVAMNVHREVCLLSTSGTVPLTTEQILRCTQIASTKVAEITDLIKKALSDGSSAIPSSPAEAAMDTADSILMSSRGKEDVAVPPKKVDEVVMTEEKASCVSPECAKGAVAVVGRGTAEIGMGGSSAWSDDDGEKTSGRQHGSKPVGRKSSSSSADKKAKQQVKAARRSAHDDDSDEDVVVLTGA